MAPPPATQRRRRRHRRDWGRTHADPSPRRRRESRLHPSAPGKSVAGRTARTDSSNPPLLKRAFRKQPAAPFPCHGGGTVGLLRRETRPHPRRPGGVTAAGASRPQTPPPRWRPKATTRLLFIGSSQRFGAKTDRSGGPTPKPVHFFTQNQPPDPLRLRPGGPPAGGPLPEGRAPSQWASRGLNPDVFTPPPIPGHS